MSSAIPIGLTSFALFPSAGSFVHPHASAAHMQKRVLFLSFLLAGCVLQERYVSLSGKIPPRDAEDKIVLCSLT
jgi:hypothetical protein